MHIGYARVSTREQNLDRQIDALTHAGCERIYTDKISTRREFEERQEWTRMWDTLRAGDVLVVHELDRMGRSTRDLLEILRQLHTRDVELRVLHGTFANMDTKTPLGQLMFQIAAAFGEYERNVNRHRTMDGLAAARKRGVVGGRKKKLTEAQEKQVAALYSDVSVSVVSIAEQFGITTQTVRRIAARIGAKIANTENSGSSTRKDAINEQACLPAHDHPGAELKGPSKGPETVQSEGRTRNGDGPGRSKAVRE